MKLTFRWYGKKDPISLDKIRQIPGMKGIVSAVYDVPVGEVWPIEKIRSLKQTIEASGLSFEVVESVPVSEDIKLGLPSRDKLIAHYAQTLLNLGQCGVKVVCYNFMPVFDWTRTSLDFPSSDGSHSLAYSKKELEKMNPLKDGLALPGWDRSYQKDELKRLLQEYQSVDEEKLFANLLYFLNGILPSAHQAGIRLAIHPDDPPWPIFSLPRIIRDEAHIDRLLKAVDVPENGITLCTGSLGASPQNDLVHLADKYSAMDRVPFLHLRNVLWTEEGFVETSEVGGSLDIPGIARVLVKNHWDGYVRSDHGRMIWGEKGRPGYGLYDRALSATYIEGLFNALEGKKGSL